MLDIVPGIVAGSFELLELFARLVLLLAQRLDLIFEFLAGVGPGLCGFCLKLVDLGTPLVEPGLQLFACCTLF